MLGGSSLFALLLVLTLIESLGDLSESFLLWKEHTADNYQDEHKSPFRSLCSYRATLHTKPKESIFLKSEI